MNEVEIFATKGVEYLLVIGFLVALVIYWRVLNAGGRPATAVGAGAPRAAGWSDWSGWFRLEPELYYHPGHAWVRPDDEGLVTVGIDDFGQKLVGRAQAWPGW